MNDTNQTDQILEELRPRMEAARVSHLRKVFACVAAVPLLGFGAVAMASTTADDDPGVETATAPIEDDSPDVTLPEIGQGGGGETNDAGSDGDESDEVETVVETTTTTTTAAPDPDAPQSFELGALGTVDVKPTAGSFEVLAYGLTDGWEVLSTESGDGILVIVIGNGEVMKTITIEQGVRDEITVAIAEFVIPTTTTTVKPEPKPEPEPEPTPIVDRFVMEVPGKGSFVVERAGDTLYVGNVTANEGVEYEIQKAQGWKVYVGFYGEDHVTYGKALINDAGAIEQTIWTEEFGPQPAYQWVEIGGVGAAKFEIYDGQIRLFKTETAEGFESWDYNQGAAGPTIKVDFEGEGQIWFIDAWLNDNGELAWNSYQG